jgi:hypothetical protein
MLLRLRAGFYVMRFRRAAIGPGSYQLCPKVIGTATKIDRLNRHDPYRRARPRALFRADQRRNRSTRAQEEGTAT